MHPEIIKMTFKSYVDINNFVVNKKIKKKVTTYKFDLKKIRRIQFINSFETNHSKQITIVQYKT